MQSDHRPMFFSWPDVVSAAVRSRKAPEILRATKLVPVARQPKIVSHMHVLPDLVIHTENDPTVALVARRRQAKADGDKVLTSVLHALVNSLVSGVLSRFDEIKTTSASGNRRVYEKPGPYTFLPIATSVQAGARLLLGIFDRMVDDHGGIVAYRDTDSPIIPASCNGGTITLNDGSLKKELAWAEIDAIRSAFAPLSPEE